MAQCSCRQQLITGVVFWFVLLAVTSLVSTQQLNFPDNNVPAVIMEALLGNQRVIKSFVNCYLDLAPCSSQANQSKQYFQQRYSSKCSNCTEEQTKNFKMLCLTFYSKYKGDYDKIVAKYDPNQENSEEFLAWLTDSNTNK